MVMPMVPTVRSYPSGLVSRNLSVPSVWQTGMNLVTPGYRAVAKEPELELPADVPMRRKVQYDCIMFHGPRGDGKTTSAVATCKRLKHIWSNLGLPHKLFANFKVNFADMCHPKLVDQIVTFPDWCHDCLILIDELASCFPSLRAASREQLLFQTFLQQIRKLHVSMLFTTQYPTYVGAASNIQINWYIKPHLYNWHYYPPVRDYVADCIGYEVVDWFGGQTGFPIMHRWPPRREDVCMRRSLEHISEIYPQYDSDEIITPFFVPNRQSMIERAPQWAEEVAQEIEEREETRKALVKARKEVKEVVEGTEATTLEEFFDSLKVRLIDQRGKPEKLNDLVGQVSNLKDGGEYQNRNRLKEELEAKGYNVQFIGRTWYVGVRE